MHQYITFAIVLELIKRKKLTAKYLAEKFEISVRTVHRYLFELECAGLPIETKQGKYGGISLGQNFVLEELALTQDDRLKLKSILENTKNGEEFINKLNL